MSDTLVIDLETKKTFAEVGGEENICQLGISVAGAYSYEKDAFFAYEEHELGLFEELLKNAGHLIGFNINHFDIPVLRSYVPALPFEKMTVTDMFEDVTRLLGHRIGLGVLAQSTLGAGKSANGLEALQWFREGRVEDVKQYCLNDVRITRDLYEYGKRHHHVLFTSRTDGKIHAVPVDWGKLRVPIVSVLEDALRDRRRLAIEYISSEDSDGLGFKKDRLIDVYKVKKNEVEAFCHLRNSVRNFRLNRIFKAELTQEFYTLPTDAQRGLF